MDLLELKRVEDHNLTRHPWEQARLKFALFFLKKRPPKNAITDIGSGDGYIAKGIAQTFPHVRVTAVDIHYSEAVLKNIQESCLPNIEFAPTISILQDVPVIDTVLLMDVIEHIKAPLPFLKEILQLSGISSETRFIITVPAFQSLFSKHDAALEHYKRYNRRELVQLLSAANMQVLHSGYFFTSLLGIRIFQKLNSRFPASQGLHNWKGGKWVTRFSSLFFWMEFKISWYLSHLRIYLPGLTCYCICCPLPS